MLKPYILPKSLALKVTIEKKPPNINGRVPPIKIHGTRKNNKQAKTAYRYIELAYAEEKLKKVVKSNERFCKKPITYK